MIEFFKNWCEGIIVAVIISIIIESILPEGNNRKYVKVVIGIYIIFTILNPFLGKLDTDIEFTNMINMATIETSAVDTENIKQMYTSGIEETLKMNIEEKFGYKVNKINITYDENFENIENINIEIQNTNIVKVEKVEIGKENEVIEEDSDYDDVKKYISENYELDKDKISIT